MAGLNYSYLQYKNQQSGSYSDYTVSQTESYVQIGTLQYNFEESYNMHLIEVPLMLSYRFVLSKYGSLHINAGGYVNYGLSAKLKLSGASEANGKNYPRVGDFIFTDKPAGDFSKNIMYESDIDLYKKLHSYTTIGKSGDMGLENQYSFSFQKSPLKRFNYGLKFGATYELKGFQIGATYNLMLSNMANDDYFEGTRIPILLETGQNNMKGYKQKINSLEIKLGYVLRY